MHTSSGVDNIDEYLETIVKKGDGLYYKYGDDERPLKARTVDALSLKDMKNFIAKRPVYSVLSTEKYQRLTEKSPRDWRDAVFEYVQVQTKL